MAKIIRSQANWCDKFNERFISGCDVLIYGSNYEEILSGYDIKSFHYSGRAKRVMDYFPSEEIELNILHWQTYKTDFVKGELINVIYDMDNSTLPTTSLPFIITDIKINKKRNEATIFAHSIFEEMIKNVSETKTTTSALTNPTYTFSETGISVNTLFTNILNKYTFNNTTKTIYGTYGSSTLKKIPANITDGELLQHICMITHTFPYVYSKMGHNHDTNLVFGLKKVGSYDYSSIYFYDLTFNTSQDITIEEIDKQNIALIGANIDNTSRQQEQTYLIMTSQYSLSFIMKIPNNVVVKTATISTGALSVDNPKFSYVLKNDKITGIVEQTGAYLPQGNYTFTITYNDLDYPTEQTQGYLYLTSPFVSDITSTEQNRIINYYTTYYSRNLMVEFNGRLDPYIQPCDIIKTDQLIDGTGDDYSNIFVEEVDVDYSGAFKVRIRGRMNSILMPYVEDVVSSGSWHIDISNFNYTAMTLYIDYGGGNPPFTISVSARSSIILNHDNASVLDSVVQQYEDELLPFDVDAWFVDSNGNQSDKEVVLEEND